MLFDPSDRETINRCRVRKSCEFTVLSVTTILPPAIRSVISNQLAKDMQRCIAMMRMSENDFSCIESDIELFEDETLLMPPELYDRYMSIVDPDARDDEGQFMWAVSFMIANMSDFKDGIDVSRSILDGGSPITDSYVLGLIRARSVYESCLDYCSGHDGSDEVDYAGAADYIGCMIEECSIMMRLSSTIDDMTDEICLHIEWADSVDPASFMAVCMPELSEHDLDMIGVMDHEFDRKVMYGYCFASFQMQ